MADTLLVSAVSAGDQSDFGNAGVENKAQGIFQSGFDAARYGIAIAGSALPARALGFGFSEPALRPPATAVGFRFGGATVITGVGVGEQSSFGQGDVVNAAQGVGAVGFDAAHISAGAIAAPRPGVGLGFTQPLVHYSAKNVPFPFGHSLLISAVSAGDAAVFGVPTARIAHTIAPVGVDALQVSHGLVLADASINGSGVHLGLSAALTLSTRFDFGAGARPITQATADDLGAFGVASLANAAQGVFALGFDSYTPSTPILRISQVRGGVVDIDLHKDLVHWPAQNVPFYFNAAVGFGPLGFDSLEFGSAAVSLGTPSLLPDGIDSLNVGVAQVNAAPFIRPGPASFGARFGTPSIYSTTQEVFGAGGVHDLAFGRPSVWLYTRYLKPGGMQAAGYGTAWASHWLRYITAAGVGDKTARGTPWISHSPRELEPPGFDAMKVLESHVVGGTRTVAPVGTEMTEWGTRIIPEGQTLYPQGFAGDVGTHDVQLYTRYLRAQSFQTNPDDLRFGRQDVWNLRQYVTQDYDPNDGLNPPPFGQWTGIENRNKEPVPVGWLSERHGYTSIFNNAVVVAPNGINAPADEPFHKAGSITHRVRPLQLDGWDSAEQSRWAAVFNVADPLLPAGVDALELGKPSIENRSRLYDKVGNFDSMELGTPMVAERVRQLRIEERHTIEPPQIELPEVKLGTRYLEYVSAGDFAGAGMPVLDIRWTVVTPRWAFHPPAWIGEPALRNVTPELRTGGANHEEFGTPGVRTQWRTVETMYGDMVQWGRPIVRDRRHWVEFVTVGAPPLMMPGPKVTKVGGLPDAQGIQPRGIAPPPRLEDQVPRPALNLLFAYPSGFDSVRYGTAKVTANSIRVEPGIGEYLVGEPGVSLKNRVLDVTDKGIEPLTTVGRPRLSPHTIYAVMDAPSQARQNHPRDGLHYVDHDSSGRYLAGPGRPSVSNQHRWIRASGIGAPSNNPPRPRIFNKQSVIAVGGSTHLRMGWPSIPGPQAVDLDQSGWLSQAFGVTTVKRPPYVGPLHVNATGFNAASFGAGTRVEHFHRAMTVPGWNALALGASKPGDTPYTWQGLRAGPLMPTIPKGFNAEQFGTAWVSLRVRDVFVPGDDFMQVAEYDPMEFAKRMLVRNASTPRPPAQGVGPAGFDPLAAGTPGTRMGAHYIRPDGNAEQYRKGAP